MDSTAMRQRPREGSLGGRHGAGSGTRTALRGGVIIPAQQRGSRGSERAGSSPSVTQLGLIWLQFPMSFPLYLL